MNVSLAPALEEYIRHKVATGPYSDATEVIQAALRLMLDHETGNQRPPRKDEIVATLKALEPELRGRGVASVALFGSIVQGRARSDSDVDVLIGLDPTARFDLIDLVGVRNLLADRLGRVVDVVEQGSLKPPIRDRMLAESETVFG